MKKYAIIVAAGSGKRMGNNLPKQFLPLNGQPVLYHTLTAFLMAFEDLQVILVLPEEHIFRGKAIAAETKATDRIVIVAGGETRFQSVRNGLAAVKDDAIVFVHDGVRCMVSQSLISRCYELAAEKGSAIPAVTATDSIRIMEGETHHVADRNNVRIIQTPQTFDSTLLKLAFAQPEQPAFTDEASVVEAMGKPVFLIEGDYDNIKITRPIDLVIAQKILENRLTL